MITKAKPSDLASLYDEMVHQIQSMLNYFIMFRECDQISNYLFRLTQKSVRSLFEHLKALLDQIDLLIYSPKAKDVTAMETEAALIRSATGMIWSVQEDLRGLPGNNRNAFRRSVLVQVTAVRDTIREYEEYLEEAEMAKLNGDEIVDDPDDDMQSVPYTDDEVAIVTDCVDKMKLCEKTMKFGLQFITLINDYMEPSLTEKQIDTPSVGASTSSLPPQPGVPSRESSGISDVTLKDLQLTDSKTAPAGDNVRADAVKELRVLTSTMSEVCTLFMDGSTDLGLELFSPFDMNKVNSKLGELSELLRRLHKDSFLRMEELFVQDLKCSGEMNTDGKRAESSTNAVVDKYLKIKDELIQFGVLLNA